MKNIKLFEDWANEEYEMPMEDETMETPEEVEVEVEGETPTEEVEIEEEIPAEEE
jgi:hypothetical protein